VSLLSFASSDKTIDCTFSDIEWFYFDRSFRTCNIDNQAIDSAGFTIASSVDSTVQGFSIQNNLKVEFHPENLSEKFPSLIVVQFWNSSIKSIDEHHLKGLRELVQLNYGYNKIESIDSNAFKDNGKLEELALGYNKIKTLSDDLLSSLVNLKRLFLDGNQIRIIDANLFKHTTSLEVINMDHNQIRFLHSETFTTLSNLKNISIASNQLESIDGSLLEYNKKLEWAWFENNTLAWIDGEAFDDKKNLRYVDLRQNFCIHSTFDSSSFPSMWDNLVQVCSPTIDSLKRDISSLKKEYLERYDNLNAQMTAEKTENENEAREWSRQKAEFENKISDLNASLKLKEK
jgi:Leucine-rich repeat (LRR) protein